MSERPTPKLVEPDQGSLPASDEPITVVDFRRMLQDLANEYRASRVDLPFRADPPTQVTNGHISALRPVVTPGLPEWVWALTGAATAMLVQSLLWLWLGP
jgi:hypothetical protein